MTENPNASIHPEVEKALEIFLTCFAPFQHALEFGTGAGKATEIISRHVRTVDTFDHDQRWTDHTREKLKERDNIFYHVGYEPIRTGYTFDFVFVDGPPNGPRRQETLKLFWPEIDYRAVIVMDDCNRQGEKDALEEWKNHFGITYHNMRIGRGLGIFTKRSGRIDD